MQVDRVLGKISEVSTAMVILLVLEGCVVFLAASLYVLLLIKQMVSNRANLFSVFLVIPTGFLRALASKQVQLDEDGDSDDDSDAGDVHQEQEQDGQKVRAGCLYTLFACNPAMTSSSQETCTDCASATVAWPSQPRILLYEQGVS